jgi:hypothetical protein
MSEMNFTVFISEHKKILSEEFSVPENQRFSWHPKNKCDWHIVFLITDVIKYYYKSNYRKDDKILIRFF